MSPHPVSGLQRHDKGDRLVAICNADTTSKVSYFKIAERQGWFFAKIIPVIGDGRHGEQVTSPLCSPRDDLNGPALCINILEEILQPGLRGFSGIYRRALGHTGKTSKLSTAQKKDPALRAGGVLRVSEFNRMPSQHREAACAIVSTGHAGSNWKSHQCRGTFSRVVRDKSEAWAITVEVAATLAYRCSRSARDHREE